MTYNVDEGTDYLEVQTAHTQTEFLLGVGQLINNVRATKPSERMMALGRQIVVAKPDIVSLQEVSLWSTGPFNPSTGTCGPVTVEFDLLQSLLDSLARQGGRYSLVVQANQLVTPPVPGLIPPSTFLCAQVANRIALLTRMSSARNRPVYDLSNIGSGHYVNQAFFALPIGSLPSNRAWVSADVRAHGRVFRIVGTHLESFDASIRQLQGAELRSGPAKTRIPVVLAMDSNAQANPSPTDPAYTEFIAGGFDDVWARLHPSDHGYTCCQAPLVNNSSSQLSFRVDLILTRGREIFPRSIDLFGAEQSSRTNSGLWPSDHAGVEAALRVGAEDD